MGEPKVRSLVTPEMLAKALGVDVQWVWGRARKGLIPKVPNMGKLIRFTPETIKDQFNIVI